MSLFLCAQLVIKSKSVSWFVTQINPVKQRNFKKYCKWMQFKNQKQI